MIGQKQSRVLLIYAGMVGFKATENDPEKEIYKKFVALVKKNEDSFFTKTGDFRKKFLISDSEIREMISK